MTTHTLTGGDTAKYPGSTVYPHRLQVAGSENGSPGYGILLTGSEAKTWQHAGVIDMHGGTRAELELDYARGLLIQTAPGDVLDLDGQRFTVSLDRRGYPDLTAVTA